MYKVSSPLFPALRAAANVPVVYLKLRLKIIFSFLTWLRCKTMEWYPDISYT